MMPFALLGKSGLWEMVILVGVMLLIVNDRLPRIGGGGPFSIP
jgi:hypothetical protein